MALGIAIVTVGQVEIKGGGGINFSGFSKDHEDWTSERRIGYQFGAGVMIGQKFYAEPSVYWLRIAPYSWGLTKVMKEGSDAKLRGFSANLGIRIPF